MKLSASAGARRGSDNTLGVPSPPPPPWKARHSERPPGPGGVEVIRAVQVTADAQATAAAASSAGARDADGRPTSGRPNGATPPAPAEQETVAEVAQPGELPGAEDPPLSDWEPTISPSRPAMRPDRAPPHVSVPYALPASTDELESAKPGRNWIPWIIIGSGLVATLAIASQFGRPVAGVPVDDTGEAANEAPVNDSPLAPENQFVPKKAEPEPDPQSVAPRQVIVQLHVEPLGAKVTALGQSATSPGRLSFPFEMVQWPLRLRVEMAGYGGTEMALPRQVFAREDEAIVHELYVTLQPVGAAAAPPAQPQAPPAQDQAAKPDSRRSQGSKPSRSPKPEEPAPTIGTAPPPGAPAPPEPAQAPAPAVASGGSAFDRALECLSRGDNACVLSTLASSTGARELDLLIETHRAAGDASSAEAAMRRYLELHPDGRRASQYRRALGVTTP
jgi:hypothetical protein